MKLNVPLVLAALLVPFSNAGCSVARAETSDPAKVQIVTSDIPRFWQAFDDAAKSSDPAGVFQKEYFDQGTAGVRGFTPNRLVSSAHLASTVAKYRDYYVATRPYMTQIADYKPQITADLQKFKTLYPDARFPDVYFVVGAMNSAGTAVEGTGEIMGSEMLSRPPQLTVAVPGFQTNVLNTADKIPGTVVHEFTHYNQHVPNQNTLLDATIDEGTADFMADIIEPSHVPKDQWAFGCAHEGELWKAFSAQMTSTNYKKDIQPWLFSYDPGPMGSPPFIGYWLGSRIVQTYYETHGRSKQAISDALNIKDFKAFLHDSGYPDHRPPCKAPTM